MYPVTLGFSEAEARIRRLIKNDHPAEALLTSVFTFEKTLRRSLKHCVVSRGFTPKSAEEVIGRRGFHELVKLWPCFAPDHKSLASFIGPKWQHVPSAVTMRNKLVHGERVYKLVECGKAANQVLDALLEFRSQALAHVGFDGWSRVKVRRNARLLWNP
jgi:hypothetical protein